VPPNKQKPTQQFITSQERILRSFLIARTVSVSDKTRPLNETFLKKESSQQFVLFKLDLNYLKTKHTQKIKVLKIFF